MKLTVGLLICYLIARLLTGPVSEGIATTVVIGLCLLLIFKMTGSSTWDALLDWIARHRLTFCFVAILSLGTFTIGVAVTWPSRGLVSLFLDSILALHWFGLGAVASRALFESRT